jgi:threonine synthase
MHETMKLVCRECGETSGASEPVWRCTCGGLLDLEFKPQFPKRAVSRREPGMWRYREALPVENDVNIVSFGEGLTPLVKVEFGGRSVLAKLEFLFPTGSFKDRGASVLVSKAKELGIKRVVEDSSGNAGAAIAAYCARAGIACDIYVPESTSPAKLAQIAAYGAKLHRVPGTREDCAHAARRAAGRTYYASHVWNPFFFHGTKTFAFEMVEQLGWEAPDAIVLPVGNGTLLLGTYIGLKELQKAGVIQKLPKLIGVQARNCAPLHEAWNQNADSTHVKRRRSTAAEGIAIAEPVRGDQILEAVRNTGGAFVSVTEAEIRAGLKEAAQAGLLIEPSSATAVAAVRKAALPRGTVIVPLTGHGLKSAK